MERLSYYLLIVGVLCGLWDAALGMRNWSDGDRRLQARFRFAWKERKATIIGTLFVVAAAVGQVAGY